MKPLRELSEALLALFFPVPCQLCAALVEDSHFGVTCENCWSVSEPPVQSCQRCGNLLPLAPAYRATDECACCRPLTFTIARNCGRYDGALRANILNLKRNPLLCPKICQLLSATFNAEAVLQESTIIIPVPLHTTRRRERGFNQAEIIAASLAHQTGLPLDTASLIRGRATPKHRAGMDTLDRQASVTNAFQITRPRLIRDARVLLVDDLFTTGSTISACATTLLKAGAATVNVLTLARVC